MKQPQVPALVKDGLVRAFDKAGKAFYREPENLLERGVAKMNDKPAAAASVVTP